MDLTCAGPDRPTCILIGTDQTFDDHLDVGNNILHKTVLQLFTLNNSPPLWVAFVGKSKREYRPFTGTLCRILFPDSPVASDGFSYGSHVIDPSAYYDSGEHRRANCVVATWGHHKSELKSYLPQQIWLVILQVPNHELFDVYYNMSGSGYSVSIMDADGEPLSICSFCGDAAERGQRFCSVCSFKEMGCVDSEGENADHVISEDVWLSTSTAQKGCDRTVKDTRCQRCGADVDEGQETCSGCSYA